SQYVYKSNGAKNSAAVETALHNLLGKQITVIVWDGSHSGFTGGQCHNDIGYHIYSFARIRLLSYEINGHGQITFSSEGTGKCDDSQNTAPIITLPAGDITYIENQSPVLIDPSATIVDYDSPDFDGGTLTADLTTTGLPEDALSLTNEGSASGQIGLVAD